MYKKTILMIIFIAVISISAYSQQYDNEKDFQIDWDDNVKDGVIITKYLGSKKEIRIPPSIQNNPVTKIGRSAFKDNRNITRVTIPDNVTNIGERAFEGCTKLTSIIIPNSVSNIGDCAFAGCISLTDVTIGNNVTSIGEFAFYNTKLTNITIPSSVTNIGYWAFLGCTNLTSVTFQGKITSDNLAYFAFGDDLIEGYIGDLRNKYLASDGGPGTYTRFANGEVWKKR